MVQLNDEEVNRIAIQIGELQNTGLQTDLLDHFCCAVEARMAQGFSFDDSLKDAWEQISPNGIREIEEELFLMFHSKHYLFMKRMLYVSGFVSSFSLTLHFLFKVVHWPGATELLIVGNVFLLFGVIPSLFLMSLRNRPTLKGVDKFRLMAGITSTFLFTVGMLFKVMHWPGANMLLVIGLVLFAALFLPVFFYQLYQRA
jgi:hypothetical protein